MSQNLDALREEREQIAYIVSDFLADRDAIASINAKRALGCRAVPWNILYLATKAFFHNVERHRQCGCLLYLHDGCSLKKGT